MPKLNTNEFDQLYRRTKTRLGSTGKVIRLSLNRIKAKQLRVLTHVTVENKDGTTDICRIGICNGGRDHYVDELLDVAAAELAVSRSDIVLGENDIFFAEFTGTASTDNLVMTCVGWEQSL